MGRNTRMQQWINYRIRVTLKDGRMLVGTFMAFDRHMNMVLADCEEFRRIKAKKGEPEKEVKRAMGLVMTRGDAIVTMTAEAPPPSDNKRPGEGPMAGPGRGQVAGRGVPVGPLGAAPPGLMGPVRGVGGPAPAQMIPQRPMGPPLPAQPGGMPLIGGIPSGAVRPAMFPPAMGGAPPGMLRPPMVPAPGGAPQMPVGARPPGFPQ